MCVRGNLQDHRDTTEEKLLLRFRSQALSGLAGLEQFSSVSKSKEDEWNIGPVRHSDPRLKDVRNSSTPMCGSLFLESSVSSAQGGGAILTGVCPAHRTRACAVDLNDNGRSLRAGERPHAGTFSFSLVFAPADFRFVRF